MIALCPNPFRDINLDFTLRTRQLLSDNGFECVICPIFSDTVTGKNGNEIPVVKLEEAENISLFIVFGGDGTILELVRRLNDYSKPVLGVNLGTKGFMTALEPEEFSSILDIAQGHYRISQRMMIDCSLIRNGTEIYSGYALNDVVVHGYGDTIQINVFNDNDKMISFSGDGIIASTPTGSTGYSLSAGGPIVEPESRNIILSPICAHLMSSRSFVVNPERIITVTVEKLHDRKAYLSLDGSNVFDLSSEDVIKVNKSVRTVNMVISEKKNFFELVFEKLS